MEWVYVIQNYGYNLDFRLLIVNVSLYKYSVSVLCNQSALLCHLARESGWGMTLISTDHLKLENAIANKIYLNLPLSILASGAPRLK